MILKRVEGCSQWFRQWFEFAVLVVVRTVECDLCLLSSLFDLGFV